MSWQLIGTGFRVIRWSAVAGFAEFRAVHTWRTWTFGWLMRMIAQVGFFSLLGSLIGSPAQTRYLVVGNAVMVACLEAVIVVTSTSVERYYGTLPLLVAAPYGYVTAFLGRGVQWLCTGIISSMVALTVSAQIFEVRLPWPETLWVPPLTLVSALGAYGLGAFVASLAMWVPSWSRVIMNVTCMTMMVICGVMVPVNFWPAWVQAIANLFPLTHGLAGVRGILDGASTHSVVLNAGVEAIIGVSWLVVATFSYRRLARIARKNGAIEFES
jgi:ABC-2 type transport system permease protein